jgi:Cu-Zn family superoxide dismutase
MMRAAAVMVMAGGLALAACNENRPATGTPVAGGQRATAMLMTAAGVPVGRATATDVRDGMRVTFDGRGLPAGTHGIHVHTVGRCDAPDFASAGGHWNPTAKLHGSMNPQGPHEGDLPNLMVDTGGRGTIGAVIPGASVAALMDADGAALIVHEKADDLQTDPSGNSGGRIACGVFSAG